MVLKAASKICEMALYSINIDVAPGRLYWSISSWLYES